MSKDTRRAEKKAKINVEASTPEPVVEVEAKATTSKPKAKAKVEAKAAEQKPAAKKTPRITNAELAEMTRKLCLAVRDCQASLDEAEDAIVDHEERLIDLEVAVFGKAKLRAPEPEPPVPDPEPEPPAPTSDPEPEIRPVNGTRCKNGAGYAFKFWQAATRTWGLTSDIWAAKQLSNGVYDPIWVWYVDDKIDHILTNDEIKKYAP